MQAVYRRLLRLLPKLGMQVLDLGPGDAWVVARARHEGPRSTSKTKKTKWKSFPLGDTGAHLLLDPKALTGDERLLQLAAARYLCAHHVTALLDKYAVNCVFDVGAHAGQYGRRLRRLGYTGRIVSFEPTAEAFAKLQKKAENDPDWWVCNIGLGREEATQDIHVDWNSMNSLLPPTDYGRGRYKRFANSRTEQIEIRRLDAVMDEALDGLTEPRPYLKMDTQGYDLEVFAGAGKRIDDFVGMQSEVALLQLYEGSPRMHEAVAVYEDSGFEITGMYPVTREPATGRVVEFDCVMMRAASAA